MIVQEEILPDGSRARTILYSPRPAFQAFHRRVQRLAVLVCHRRAGKTVAICNDAQRRCLTLDTLHRPHAPARYAWFYPTRVRAKDIAWGYLKYYAGFVEGARAIESELAIEYPNGGRVTLYGADNSRGVGLWLDGVYWDEADEIPNKVVADVEPTLSDYKGFSVFAGMLKGRHNLWKRHEAALSDPNALTMLLKASESCIIDPDELARLRISMGEAAYEVQMECNPNAAMAAAIYGKQMEAMRREGRLGRVSRDPAAPLWCFLDLGHSLRGDDWAIWAVQPSGRDILVLRCYSRTGELPAHYAKVMTDWEREFGVPLTKVFLPHDGARQDRKGKSAKDDLEEAGLHGRVEIVNRSPHIWDGISELRSLMPQMWIDEKGCGSESSWRLGEVDMPSGIDALDFYAKKEQSKDGLIVDVPDHNVYSHLADALRTFAEAHRLGMLEGPSAFAREAKRGGEGNRDVKIGDGRGMRPPVLTGHSRHSHAPSRGSITSNGRRTLL